MSIVLVAFVAGLFVGGLLVVATIVMAVTVGRALGKAIGSRIAKTKAPVAAKTKDTPVQDSDTDVVRAALKQLRFSTREVDYAVAQVRGRALPVHEKIRAALMSLDRAKEKRL